MRTYKHRPIDTKSIEIRVLRIDTHHGELAVRIRHMKLEDIRDGRTRDGSQFFALSYAWGDLSVRHPLVICEAIVEDAIVGRLCVRENLFNFLQTACNKQQSWDPSWFWIDQLCIDQSNTSERCH